MAETLSRGSLTTSAGIRIHTDTYIGLEQMKIEALPERSRQDTSSANYVMVSPLGTHNVYFVSRGKAVSFNSLGMTADYIGEPESTVLTASNPAIGTRGRLSTLARNFLIKPDLQPSGDVTIIHIDHEGIGQNAYDVASLVNAGNDLDLPTQSNRVLFEYPIINHVGRLTGPSGLHAGQGAGSDAAEERIDSRSDHAEDNSAPASPLHPLAMEFELGTMDEPPPKPAAVAMADYMLKSIETSAKDSEISIDVDGAMSFTIVAIDGTLISGEFATSGRLYAWHYEPDWSTQRAELVGEEDISILLGWLG